jgi:TorA maturation chaperone TorD
MDTIALNRMVEACNLWPWFTKWIEKLSEKSQKKLYEAVERRYDRNFK